MIQTADLTRNVKQASFFNTVLAAAVNRNPYRYLFYGGAIRGGKTFACLICLILLCKIFPGSKWYIIRKSFTNLQETTIPTMNKILANSPGIRWSRDRSNYFVEFRNGSRIFFAGENYNADPKLNWMLGLEANGFFLEQAEELQELTLDMCISRCGSWIIPKMPTPLILGSFNPTLTWIRQKIFVPYSEGKLEPPFFYQEAGPKDNPFVTEEQWAGWANMAQELQDQFIGGSWDFAKPSNVFAYSFDEKKHHADVHIDPDFPLFVSFDFNVEPITCLFEQHDLEWVHICKELRLLNSDIWALTDHIIVNHAEAFFMVTGDATGRARSAISRGNRSYYQIIQQQLQLSTNQIKVPRANPSVRNTRVLTNSLFSKHPHYLVNTKACPHLTLDLNGVVVNEKGEIDKTADKRATHLLDCLRYNNWTWHRDFLDRSLYQYLGND